MAVTRNVSPDAVGDLLDAPPRAMLAFDDHGHIGLLPVRFRRDRERYFVGLGVATNALDLAAGASVSVLIDDGWYFYELRAVKLRCRLGVTPPDARDSDVCWRELIVERIVAWDYASMREE